MERRAALKTHVGTAPVLSGQKPDCGAGMNGVNV